MPDIYGQQLRIKAEPTSRAGRFPRILKAHGLEPADVEIALHEGLADTGSAQVKVRAPGGSRGKPER